MMSALASTSDCATVWALLDALTDPEIPAVSLRELGILRDVRQSAEGAIDVVITPTYSGCPAMGQIEDDIHTALAALGVPVRVLTQLAPAWTTDWMTPTARDKLRRYGIAPPQGSSESAPGATTGAAVVRFASRRAQADGVPCPQCGSGRTTETSHFSSTACKALYKCLDCMEPFDYFKPY